MLETGRSSTASRIWVSDDEKWCDNHKKNPSSASELNRSGCGTVSEDWASGWSAEPRSFEGRYDPRPHTAFFSNRRTANE